MDQDKYKDIRKSDIQNVSIYSNTAFFTYVHKKGEKITTALYLITNLFSDSEPLKWKLREKSLSLIELLTAAGGVSYSFQQEHSRAMVIRVSELIALLEVARVSGLMSEMNYLLIRREYQLLAEMVQVRTDARRVPKNFVLSNDFFHVPDTGSGGVSVSEGNRSLEDIRDEIASRFVNVQPRRIIKGHNPVLSDIPRSEAAQTQSEEREIPPVRPQVTQAVQSSPGKNDRREIILRLAAQKQDLSIKDITQIIQDVSEKTIQRELISLVTEGVLKKAGERRWSRYSLV